MPARLIQDLNGEIYSVDGRIGGGAQAEVWKVKNVNTNNETALKEYAYDPFKIKENIKELVNIKEIVDVNGDVLKSVVLPQAIVEFKDNPQHFGYIMNLIDLSEYTTLPDIWCNSEYPSLDGVCEMLKELSHVFDTLHGKYGLVYKDVNETNIYLNPDTGEIKVIDNDNIGSPEKYTVSGSGGYMAPEVILGKLPDRNSDRFSFAVFAYRLLIGAFPFEGPYTEKYCLDHDVLLDDDEARKLLLGSDPVFVWNPVDKRNNIENEEDPSYKSQVLFWKSLPEAIREKFLDTFVVNVSPDRASQRTSNKEWYETFDEVEKTLVECPNCHKKTFPGDHCFCCGAELPENGTCDLKYEIVSYDEKSQEKIAAVGEYVNGKDVSKWLEGQLFQVLYNAAENKIGLRNVSEHAWVLYDKNGYSGTCLAGSVVPVEPGLRIEFALNMAEIKIKQVLS